MSLFHSPRELREISSNKKRKRPDGESEEKYSCDLCDDDYDNETDLHVHRKSIHRVVVNQMLLDEMVCKTCINKHESYEHLVKHIKTQHLLSFEDSEYVARDIYICNWCHLIYFNKQMLTVHIQYSHERKIKKEMMTSCPVCSKGIRVRNAWYHLERHWNRSIGCCPICLRNYKNQNELNSHVQEHASYYKCNICQYEACNKNYFNTHMQKHKSKEVPNVKFKEEDIIKRCFVPQINTRRSVFNAGIRGLKLFELQICVLCRAICTHKTRTDHILQCHVVHRAPEIKKQHACLCGEVFFNNILLRHHVFKMNNDDHRPSDSIDVKSSVEAEPSVNLETESVNFDVDKDPGVNVNVTVHVENTSLPDCETGATENVQ